MKSTKNFLKILFFFSLVILLGSCKENTDEQPKEEEVTCIAQTEAYYTISGELVDKYIYFYNQNKEVIKKEYWEGGEKLSTANYIYDDNKLIRIETYEDTDKITRKEEHSYPNSTKKIVKIYNTDTNGLLRISLEFHYENDKLILRMSYTSDGNSTLDYKYFYKDNFLSKVEYYENGQVFIYTEWTKINDTKEFEVKSYKADGSLRYTGLTKYNQYDDIEYSYYEYTNGRELEVFYTYVYNEYDFMVSRIYQQRIKNPDGTFGETYYTKIVYENITCE